MSDQPPALLTTPRQMSDADVAQLADRWLRQQNRPPRIIHPTRRQAIRYRAQVYRCKITTRFVLAWLMLRWRAIG